MDMLTEKQIQDVLAVERTLWSMPEIGYCEYRSSEYLIKKFEELGYTVTPAKDITGFVAELDTGIPGPTVAMIGELDALVIPSHKEADPKTGAVHACGHHIQSTIVYGVASAFKNAGACDGLCGKVRFVIVPAEEFVKMDYREQLRKEGKIRSLGGKMEFVNRGFFDGVDMAFMIHASALSKGKYLWLDKGFNGIIRKEAVFIGRTAHANGSPHRGINALHAALGAINAANALRQSFRDYDTVRFSPVIKEEGCHTEGIPHKSTVVSTLGGGNFNVIKKQNEAVNRAFAGAALSIGAALSLKQTMGYFPLNNDMGLADVLDEAMREVMGEDSVERSDVLDTGATDLGDLSTLIPCLHCMCTGTKGGCHSDTFCVTDPYAACIATAEASFVAIRKLLSNGGERAIAIKNSYKPLFADKEEYFRAASEMDKEFNAITYNGDGTAEIRYN